MIRETLHSASPLAFPLKVEITDDGVLLRQADQLAQDDMIVIDAKQARALARLIQTALGEGQ